MNINSTKYSPGAETVWSGASAPMSPTQKMAGLFDKVDTAGNGTITKEQFKQAFQIMNPPGSFKLAGADNVWNRLDPSGSGSVSKQDFIKGMVDAMKQLRGHHQHHHHAGNDGAQAVSQAVDPLNTSDTPRTTTGNGSTVTGAGSIVDLLA